MTFDFLALFMDKKQEKKFEEVLFEDKKKHIIYYPNGYYTYATKG